MTRGPTFWIVALAIAGATAGLYIEHRRANPAPPDGVTVAEVGDMAPDATYIAIDGTAHRLSEWRGKRVLINFWASWCAPCRREMPLLNAAWEQERARNIAILGVAEDTAADAGHYLAEHPVSYPVLLVGSDAPGSSLSFGNTRRVLPYSVLIGEDGRILRRKPGGFTAAGIDEWLAP